MNLLEEIRTQENIDIENVDRIDLEIGPVASTAATIKAPKIGVEGKFSVWFLAALALAEGNVTLAKFTDEKVNSPQIVTLRKKIHTSLDPRIGFGARVRILMKDGTEYARFLAKPKGDPDNPLTFAELAEKYRNAAIMAISEKKIDILIKKIKTLEQINDMNEIVALTVHPKA
ncbi:MmgE/PrpD family protein [Desulfobacula phenolica]|uniref:MmgE/PrpD family protein n=1 Tax=Desulfobacula phenolica TaxID=90732 RepID=A0A1H2FFV2_9BACT|nr:MmgE/PrpD family protein [Desulfobacula phenolica]SDU06256.1 MmgE/PrpD family protein [Desulfobacula phenolica]